MPFSYPLIQLQWVILFKESSRRPVFIKKRGFHICGKANMDLSSSPLNVVKRKSTRRILPQT